MPDAHPPYQELAPPSPKDYERLKEDVARYGFRDRIDVDENDETLDGHTRLRIAAELGLDPPGKRVISGLSETEKRLYAIRVNLARRQLTIEEKRALTKRQAEIVEMMLREDPTRSDRSVAAAAGTTHPTVAARRRDLEENGKLSITRGRGRAKREEVDDEPTPPEVDRRDVANHRNESRWEVTGYYSAPGTDERTRNGLPYTRESETQVWFSREMVVTMPPPRNRAEVRAYTEAIRARLEQQMLADPLLTMGDDEEPVTQVSPTASVYVG